MLKLTDSEIRLVIESLGNNSNGHWGEGKSQDRQKLISKLDNFLREPMATFCESCLENKECLESPNNYWDSICAQCLKIHNNRD